MIDIKLTHNIDKLGSITNDFKSGVSAGLRLAIKKLELAIKNQFGKGNAPKIRTGRLKNSVTSKVGANGGSVRVGAVYASILDTGGVIYGKPWLMFKIDGKFIKTDKVVIPPKPYIEPAINSVESEMGGVISDSIIKSINR